MTRQEWLETAIEFTAIAVFILSTLILAGIATGQI